MATKFTRLDWVGVTEASSAANAYINLGYYPNSKTVIEAKITAYGTTNHLLFGTDLAYGDSSTNSNQIRFYNRNEYAYFNYGYAASLGRETTKYITNGTTYTITVGNNYLYRNGSTAVSGSTVTFNRLSTPLYILGSLVSSDQNTANVIHSFIVKEDGNTIIELVPAMQNETGVVGFFDLRSGLFYKNNGSAVLSSGTVIGELDVEEGKVYKTTNLDLLINNSDNLYMYNDKNSTTKSESFIRVLDKNFSNIDTKYSTIKTSDTRLVSLLSSIKTKFAADTTTKQAINALLANKVDYVNGLSLVKKALITQLSEDYSKEQLDSLFVSNDVMQAHIDELAAEYMADYYSKDELDQKLTLGEAGSTFENIYKKAEIDAKIPAKEDLSMLEDMREAYQDKLATFSSLNGKGD